MAAVVFIFGLGWRVPNLAAGLGAADNVGLGAQRIARAAFRAAVSSLASNDPAVIAGHVNGAGAVGAHAIPSLAAGGMAGALPADVARALASAAVALSDADGADTATGDDARAAAVTWSFNQSISRRVRRAVRAAGHPELATDLIGVPAMLVGKGAAVAVPSGATAALRVVDATAVETAALAAAAHQPEGFRTGTLAAADRAIVARIARAAYGGAVAAAPNETAGAEAAIVLAVLAARTASVNTVMGVAANVAWGNTLADAARLAAYYAMIGEAEHRSGQPGATIQAAVEAISRNTVVAAADAAAVNAGAGPSIIAYSYGIMPPNLHCYTNASSLGGLGHPHPLAIAEYVARGWVTRRNTSLLANHGARQTDAVSPRGHASIEWNAGADANVAAAAVVVGPCPNCNQQISVNP